jgi:hypothetical protein
MIVFEPILRGRLNLRLKEISIGDAANLLSKKDRNAEQDTTDFLCAVVDSQNMADDLKDPKQWTVHERAFVLTSYLSQVSLRKNFEVGENGKLSDYLSFERMSPEKLPQVLGVLEGDKWAIVPMTGAMAESIEKIAKNTVGGGRAGYIMAAMAAQLRIFLPVENEFEVVPCPAQEPVLFGEFLVVRASLLSSFPETAFMALFMMFIDGLDNLNHFFKIDFSDDGLVFLPQGTEREDGIQLPPTRFCMDDCLSQPTRYFFEKY